MQVNFQFEGEDEEVWKQFKSFVMRNEGKIKGQLGRYAAEALEEYMNDNIETKKEKISRSKNKTSFRRAYGVWSKLTNGADFEVGDRVPEPVVERFIKKICGTSNVTINKYKNILTSFDLLGKIGKSSNGITVYEVNSEPEWVEEIE